MNNSLNFINDLMEIKKLIISFLFFNKAQKI